MYGDNDAPGCEEKIRRAASCRLTASCVGVKMASWKDEYLAALEARDEVEKAHLEFYEACNRTMSISEGPTLTIRKQILEWQIALHSLPLQHHPLLHLPTLQRLRLLPSSAAEEQA